MNKHQELERLACELVFFNGTNRIDWVSTVEYAKIGKKHAEFALAANPAAILELLEEVKVISDAYARACEREQGLRLERATLREAVKFAANTFRKISSSDGSGHADLAKAVLRLAGDAMGEVAP